MKSTTPKGGRPTAVYHPKFGGEPVVGLHRLADGRWRISGPEKITFTEPDERLAIARFHDIQAKRNPKGSWVDLPVGEADIHQIGPLVEKAKKGRITITIPRDPRKPVEVARGYDEPAIWAWMREQIISQPKWCAERLGIEEIGWLTTLKKPEVLPSFKEIEAVWSEHFAKSAEQRRRVLHGWGDFKKTTAIKTLDEITPAVAIAYRDEVYKRGWSPKMQENVFTRVRRLFTFARQREIAPDALAKVIDALKRLVPSDTTVSLDPHPIEPEHFHDLLDAAGPEDRAMLLLMLNGGYYCGEVVRLKWSLIKDGCIVTHRAKEGRCVRVCTLWPETIEALAKVPRKIDHIFVAYTGKALGVKGAEKRWRDLRERAKVPAHVTSSHLRDGAATAMASAGISDKLFAVLMGHRSGIGDHYTKRNPQMVRPACDAIRARYLG